MTAYNLVSSQIAKIDRLHMEIKVEAVAMQPNRSRRRPKNGRPRAVLVFKNAVMKLLERDPGQLSLQIPKKRRVERYALALTQSTKREAITQQLLHVEVPVYWKHNSASTPNHEFCKHLKMRIYAAFIHLVSKSE